jgi:phospholipid/cholesterol/gamma-HCH transport system substrate-binding protein
VQVPASGLGLANSPQENEFINELASPAVGKPPAALPSWSSVLLGPLYRGTTVNVG